MIAQAISGVIHPPIAMLHNNETFSDTSDACIIHEKISIATTLALLVGLVQVNFII